MIASLIQHTSETRQSILEYTVPELEALSVALSENNDFDNEDNSSGTSSSKKTEDFYKGASQGVDAIDGLKSIGLM